MNPISSWLDPAEVRRLAEQLMWPTREPATSPPDAGFAQDFVGFTVEAPAPNATPPAPVAPSPPSPAAPLRIPVAPSPEPPVPTAWKPTAPAAVYQETPGDPARVRFLENFSRLREWLHHHHPVAGIFILDQDGAVIFEDSPHNHLHFLAKNLVAPSPNGNFPVRNVRLKIGANVMLEIIPVDANRGRFAMGIVVPSTLPPDAIETVIKEFKHMAANQGPI